MLTNKTTTYLNSQHVFFDGTIFTPGLFPLVDIYFCSEHFSIHLSVNEQRGVACADKTWQVHAGKCSTGGAHCDGCRTLEGRWSMWLSSRCCVRKRSGRRRLLLSMWNVVFLWSRCILGNVVLWWWFSEGFIWQLRSHGTQADAATLLQSGSKTCLDLFQFYNLLLHWSDTKPHRGGYLNFF